MKLSHFSVCRILGVTVALIALGLTGCSGPTYTAAPPSESMIYMDLKFEKGLYGGFWYGPGYHAPRVTVAPDLNPGE